MKQLMKFKGHHLEKVAWGKGARCDFPGVLPNSGVHIVSCQASGKRHLGSWAHIRAISYLVLQPENNFTSFILSKS